MTSHMKLIPLLDEMDTLHGLKFERRMTYLGTRRVRRNQRKSFRPPYHQAQLVNEHRLASASLAQNQAKVLLLQERFAS